MRNSIYTGTRSLFPRLRVLLIMASLAGAMPYSEFASLYHPSVASSSSLSFAVSFLGGPAEALAASATAPTTSSLQWQWKNIDGRERIVVDAKNQELPSVEVKRTGLNTLTVHVSDRESALILQGQAPHAQSLVGNMQTSPAGLELALRSSAFGFLATQVSPTQIVIDVFSDPLGARWKADGGLAPVGTQAQEFTVLSPQEPVVANVLVTDVATDTPNTTDTTAIPPAHVPLADLTALAHVSHEEAVLVTQAVATEETPAVDNPKQGPEQGAEQGAEEGALPEADILPATAVAATEVVQKVQSNVAPKPDPLPQEKLSKSSENTADMANADGNASSRAEEGEKNPATVDAANAESSSEANTEANADSGPSVDDKGSEASSESAHTEASTPSRGTVISPQEVQGTINLNGPEYWPADAGIATKLGDKTAASSSDSSASLSPTSSEPGQETVSSPEAAGDVAGQYTDASPVVAENAKQQQSMDMVQTVDPASKPVDPNAVVEEPRPVIYQDEEGNEVPPPPVLEDVFAEAMKLIQEAKYKDALPLLELLLTMPKLTPDQREQVLYYRSDAVEAIYTGKPFEGYEDIVQATNEAMNANLRSSRVPDALHRLGMTNLNVGNLDEAEGYFKALRRRYPYDMHVPVDFHLLGKAKMEKGLFKEAEKIFREVLQEYPDSPAVKDGTIALVQALVGQKKFEEALVYADFADKRWARYYIDAPEYLLTLAEIDYNLGKKEAALQKYWLLYNLRPTHEDSPNILTSIGDLYFELQQIEPALEVFGDVLMRFPETDAGALALLRLSEKGLYDSPLNMATMFGVFENPGMPLPQVTYQDLYKERPSDARSITSLLKYALWQLWDKQYAESMGTAADFIDLYPENVDVELARDVIMRGFMADLKNSLLEENYGRILTLWNGFPIVRERYGEVDPDLRNALARGYLERGDDAKAMELFAEFLQTPKHPKYSDPTFALYFNKYLETGNWNAMLDLGELVKDWEMTDAMRGQLDYAMALSAENLGLRERSLKLWKQLATDTEIPKYQRAYATYFLAKDAEERKDIKDAYAYNLKTLQIFDELKQERSDRADEGRRKEAMGALMDITEVANRIPEALEWVERYNQFVDAKSPEYPGLRFREARLYRKLGNAEKAKQLLELIASGYADSPFAAAATTELATFEVSRDLQNFIPKNR